MAKKMVMLEANLSDKELEAFNRLCTKEGVCPAEKIGEIVHGFLLAEGVKHRIQKARAA